jgi:hypothetical protein
VQNCSSAKPTGATLQFPAWQGRNPINTKAQRTRSLDFFFSSSSRGGGCFRSESLASRPACFDKILDVIRKNKKNAPEFPKRFQFVM